MKKYLISFLAILVLSACGGGSSGSSSESELNSGDITNLVYIPVYSYDDFYENDGGIVHYGSSIVHINNSGEYMSFPVNNMAGMFTFARDIFSYHFGGWDDDWSFFSYNSDAQFDACLALDSGGWTERYYKRNYSKEYADSFTFDTCAGKEVRFFDEMRNISGMSLYDLFDDDADQWLDNNSFPEGSIELLSNAYYTDIEYFIPYSESQCSEDIINCLEGKYESLAIDDVFSIEQLMSKYQYTGEEVIGIGAVNYKALRLNSDIFSIVFDGDDNIHFYQYDYEKMEYFLTDYTSKFRNETVFGEELYFIDIPTEIKKNNQLEIFFVKIGDYFYEGSKTIPFVKSGMTFNTSSSRFLNGTAFSFVKDNLKIPLPISESD